MASYGRQNPLDPPQDHCVHCPRKVLPMRFSATFRSAAQYSHLFDSHSFSEGNVLCIVSMKLYSSDGACCRAALGPASLHLAGRPSRLRYRCEFFPFPAIHSGISTSVKLPHRQSVLYASESNLHTTEPGMMQRMMQILTIAVAQCGRVNPGSQQLFQEI